MIDRGESANRSVDSTVTTARKPPEGLRAYQRLGVDFLRAASSALLADEMGLGKTVQAGVALEREHGSLRRILIVTPSALGPNWTYELDRWAPSLVVRSVIGDANDRMWTYRLPIQTLLVTYEQVRQDLHCLRQSTTFDLVILDEAQRIKNAAAHTSLACRLLPRRRAWALTGTPVENRVEDLHSIFRFLKPGLLSPEMTVSQLQDAMRPHFLRRRKRDVLGELPPLLIQDVRVRLTGAQERAYSALWASRRDTLGYGLTDYGNMLGLLTRLKQLCNFEPRSGESSKLEALKLLVDSLSGPTDKLLLFSQYVETLEFLAGRLDLPVGLIHGRQRLEDRQRALTTFEANDGPRGLLVSIRAGGTGLNIPSASCVVLYDRWWNPTTELQAISRAHRFGRSGPLVVQRFLVKDTVEERIASILRDKRALIDRIVEGASGASASSLSRDELIEVLALRDAD